MAADRAPRRRGQSGETLLESLIAVAILSLLAVTAFSGLQTSLRSSRQHHDAAVAETLLRAAAERLQSPDSNEHPYIPRAGCGATPTYGGLPARTGWNPIVVTVEFWVPPPTGSTGPLTTQFSATCPAQDRGLQRLQLSLTTPGGFHQRVDILKREEA